MKHKYSEQAFAYFSEVFNWLPLGCVLGGKVFIVHGGLFSRDDVSLDELRALNRNREPPEEGLMSEMLWSDPQPQPGRSPSKRGVGLSFGPDVTKAFLERNGLKLVVRSHEVKVRRAAAASALGQVSERCCGRRLRLARLAGCGASAQPRSHAPPPPPPLRPPAFPLAPRRTRATRSRRTGGW